MRVLVACEFSGVVRRAFRARGHEAWSCDLRPSDDGSPYHLQGCVEGVISPSYDLLIAHPPCTYLCSSGLHWNKRVPERVRKTEEAVAFVEWLWNYPIDRICIENPVGCLSTRLRPADQYIQPWMFGHPESKKTGLWLKNLPLLAPTRVCKLPASGRWNNQTPSGNNKVPGGKDQWRKRSITYVGVAEAMAKQWGGL